MTSTSLSSADIIDSDLDAVVVSDVESELEGWETLFAPPEQGSLKSVSSTPQIVPSLAFHLARETSKPSTIEDSGWGSLFVGPEQGSLKCEVCMVRNGPSFARCGCCDTKKATAVEESVCKGIFSAPEHVCMFRNHPLKSRCLACENKKLSVRSTKSRAISLSTTSSTPGVHGKSVESDRFPFGMATISGTNESGGFSIGAASDSGVQAGGFKFGVSRVDMNEADEFQFGVRHKSSDEMKHHRMMRKY
mmetsp:Transcript_26575/g.55361  ORF Transcript_26575/g.55361 Transcript_26575/m.55361 type:complete len:248 (+) Transcript_26575:66-809(+)